MGRDGGEVCDNEKRKSLQTRLSNIRQDERQKDQTGETRSVSSISCGKFPMARETSGGTVHSFFSFLRMSCVSLFT